MNKRKKKTVVVVKCSSCKKTREIGPGEIDADDFPMCDTCYLPMTAVGARESLS